MSERCAAQGPGRVGAMFRSPFSEVASAVCLFVFSAIRVLNRFLRKIGHSSFFSDELPVCRCHNIREDVRATLPGPRQLQSLGWQKGRL